MRSLRCTTGLGHRPTRSPRDEAPGKTAPSALDLRPGEWCGLAALSETFSTLDEKGRLDGLPFMLEMVKYYGRALTVAQRAEKSATAYSRAENQSSRMSVRIASGRSREAANRADVGEPVEATLVVGPAPRRGASGEHQSERHGAPSARRSR
jgi:hypothetical protein